MILHLLLISMILVIVSGEPKCTTICHGNSVSYPFGFSDGCQIRLNCSNNGDILVGKYTVQNLTKDYIRLNLPATCDRELKEIQLFSNKNFAISSRSGLLFENCSSQLNDCTPSSSLVDDFYNTRRCDSAKPLFMNCYIMDSLYRAEFMDMRRLEAVGCKVLFSSVTVLLNEDISESSPVSLEFQSLDLGWWVSGECSCARNAICQNVVFETRTVGYRCQCKDGYTGDGFIAGKGCLRGGSGGSGGPDWGLIATIVAGFVVGFWIVVGPLVVSKLWRTMFFHFMHGIRFNFCNIKKRFQK